VRASELAGTGKQMSYLIKDNELIAITDMHINSGHSVRASTQTATSEIDANRDTYLVNAQTYQVSNAKKWAIVASQSLDVLHAVAVDNNESEFKLY
jgi:hypothetical protein